MLAFWLAPFIHWFSNCICLDTFCEVKKVEILVRNSIKYKTTPQVAHDSMGYKINLPKMLSNEQLSSEPFAKSEVVSAP